MLFEEWLQKRPLHLRSFAFSDLWVLYANLSTAFQLFLSFFYGAIFATCATNCLQMHDYAEKALHFGCQYF